MVKLVFSSKYPFVRLADLDLRRLVERLRQENEELRGRIVAAQHEKAVAQQQAERLRSEKERLRVRLAKMKSAGETQRRVHEVLQEKTKALRDENEALQSEIRLLTQGDEHSRETGVVLETNRDLQ